MKSTRETTPDLPEKVIKTNFNKSIKSTFKTPISYQNHKRFNSNNSKEKSNGAKIIQIDHKKYSLVKFYC